MDSVRAALEIRMELNPCKEAAGGILHSFNKLSIGAHPAEDYPGTGNSVTEYGGYLIAMPVPLLDGVLSIKSMEKCSLAYLTRICSEAHRSAF